MQVAAASWTVVPGACTTIPVEDLKPHDEAETQSSETSDF